jgi:uncharacterized lipoprotein YmbA
MNCHRLSAVWLGCCVLLGCGSSPPVRYYTLHDIPSTLPLVAAASQVPVRVQPVAVASELDRIEIVSRIGPDRLRIADSDLWAAPLEGQIRAILSSDLATRLPPLLIVDPNEPGTSEPRRLLSVAIVEFLGDPSCAVRLRADWNLRSPDGSEEHGAELVQIPGGEPCTGAAAAQMSRALGELTDRLAGVIGRNHAATTSKPPSQGAG